MKFDTKFNKDDHVWFMKNNKPLEVIISCIKIFYVGTNQDTITYSARDVSNSVSWIDHETIHEYMLFLSKESLLNSL